MHGKTLPAVLAAALLVAVAPLTWGASQHADQAKRNGAPDLQQVQRQWSEASKALMSYTAAQRDEALARGKKLLAEMDVRLDGLEAQTQRSWSKLSRSARERHREALRELRRQRNRVAEWYGGMEHSSAGAWKHVKRGFVEAYAKLSAAFGNAAGEFERGDSAQKKKS